MITLLTGENSFEIEHALDKIVGDFNGTPEKVSPTELTLNDLPNILFGFSLFNSSRLVIIRDLSSNKLIWPVLGDWINRMSSDIHLVLVEPKLDKRTAAYKALKKGANIQEFKAWSDRDISNAEKWVAEELGKNNIKLDQGIIRELVRRVGVDQWRLFHAIEKLSLIDEVTINTIHDIFEPNLSENVFAILETALFGDIKKLYDTLSILEQTEDVYRLSSLIFSQAFQLTVVVMGEAGCNVGKDFDIHPYTLSNLERTSRRISKSKAKQMLAIFCEADIEMKSTKKEPWLLIERALVKVANL